MHQIDNPWVVTAKPTAEPVGTPGWFQPGASPDLLATIVDYDWANTIQAEILNVVLAAGLVPNKFVDNQLLLAIQQMITDAPDVDPFVLKAGDTMTGLLTAPALASTGTITATGDITTSATLHAATVASTGNVTATGSVSAASATLTGSLSAASATLTGSLSAASATLTGNLGAVNATLSGDLGAVNAALSGNLSVFSAVDFTDSGSTASLFAVADAGAFRMVGSSPNFHQLGVKTYGNILSYNTPSYPTGGGAWDCDIAGNTQQAGSCSATSFPVISDASLKTKIAPFTTGLAAVRRIDPISFEFSEDAKLGTPGAKFYGVSAQTVQAVLPEAVVTMPRYLTDESAGDASLATEVLAVEPATIFYAAINAIKELAARLDALEARQP